MIETYFYMDSSCKNTFLYNFFIRYSWRFPRWTFCCILIYMQNTYWRNNKEERRHFFRKIYLSLYLKGLCVWEGFGDRTELQHTDPHSYGHQCFFPVLLMLLNRRPTLLGAGFLYRILSPTGLVSKLTDFLSSPSYIIV